MRKLLLASAIAGLLGSGSAMADVAPKWGQVGPWKISVDQTLGNGCFMVAGYGNSAFRVGIDNTSNTSYFMMFNPAWQTLVPGQQYQVAGQFDNGTVDTWTAMAITIGNVTALRVQFNTPSPAEIMQIFGRRYNFKLYYRGNVLSSLNLVGTEAAAAATINCNSQFTANRDPFAGGTRVADPFR